MILSVSFLLSLVSIWISATPSNSADVKCPEFFTPSPFGNRCFRRINADYTINGDDADMACYNMCRTENLKCSLASILNEQEFMWVYEKFRKAVQPTDYEEQPWIGLKYYMVDSDRHLYNQVYDHFWSSNDKVDKQWIANVTMIHDNYIMFYGCYKFMMDEYPIGALHPPFPQLKGRFRRYECAKNVSHSFICGYPML